MKFVRGREDEGVDFGVGVRGVVREVKRRVEDVGDGKSWDD